MGTPTDITVSEAADKLGVPEVTIRRWCRTGHLSPARLVAGKVWLIDPAALDGIARPPRGNPEIATLRGEFLRAEKARKRRRRRDSDKSGK